MKFFIDQHGCAKNQTDGELIAGFLIERGYEFTLNAEEADFILVNSCGFIQSAKKESIDAVCNIKKAYPKAKLVLTGCLAERYAGDLIEAMPELDGVFGNGDLSKIAGFMDSVSKKKRTAETFPQKGVCGGARPVIFNFPGSAFVKITEGCSNHCSFCAIPLIRGELRSRSEKEILSEIKTLVKDGVYEINLIGQDLAAYGTDTATSLAELLKKITAMPDNLFKNCISLEEIIIPDTIVRIGTGAFNGCENLKKNKLPNNLKNWGERALKIAVV